jgi:hypothetical protein
MKEARKITTAEIVWLICFILLCFYPPTLFGKALGFVICAILVYLYPRGGNPARR